MVAKKTTKKTTAKPTTKVAPKKTVAKVAVKKPVAKAAPVKSTPVATPVANKQATCLCGHCAHKARKVFVLILIIIATVIATLVVTNKGTHRKGPMRMHGCPCQNAPKPACAMAKHKDAKAGCPAAMEKEAKPAPKPSKAEKTRKDTKQK